MSLQNTLKLHIILLFFISHNASSADLHLIVRQCTEAMNAGQSDKALVAAESALKHDPSHSEALLCKGRALGALGKITDAEKTLEQASKAAKTDFDAGIAALLLGNLHRENKAYSKAIADYQNGLSHFHPQNNQRYVYISHVLLGEAHTQNLDMNNALQSYQAANKIANNDNERAESYARIASTYAALTQYDQAIEHQLKSAMMQKKAGTLDQYAEASLQLGQYYHLAKDYKNAGVTFNKLRDFAKTNGGAYYEAKADLMMAKNDLAANDTNAAKTNLDEAQKVAKGLNDAELNAEIATFAQSLNK